MNEYKLRKRNRCQSSRPIGIRADWNEWQVCVGRRIVYRADLESQAIQWMKNNPL